MKEASSVQALYLHHECFLYLPYKALLSVKSMQMTGSGRDWYTPLHPITNLTTHTNMPFRFIFPFLCACTCGHAHTHVYSLPLSHCQSVAIWARFKKWGVLYDTEETHPKRCDALAHCIRCKNKSCRGMLEDLRPVAGAIMSCVAQSQVHTELLRTKLMEFLPLCLFLCRSLATGRNKEKACESSLVAEQSGRQRETRLTAGASASLSKWRKMIYWVIKTRTNNMLHVLPYCLHRQLWIVHI